MAACSDHLRFWWTIAVIHDGGCGLLTKLGVHCGWKPMLWFVKETRADPQNIFGDTLSGGREKESLAAIEIEARLCIEKLTSPGGLVVDFFAGTGTTGAAAKALGRRWIGFEIDAGTAERASQRIEAGAAPEPELSLASDPVREEDVLDIPPCLRRARP
jgi:hypothetical protein